MAKPVTPVLLRRAAPEVVYAKDQPQYIPLPAVDCDGVVTTRWKLSWAERLSVFLSGSIWLQVLTHRRPLQPVQICGKEPAE